MAIPSPIFKILSQSQKNLSSNRDEMRNINRTLSDRQKFKRDYYAQTNFLRGKREEDERRQQLEDELEAPTVVTQSSGPAQLVQKSTSRGWFDRILGFIGYLSAGWIMNNLPTWIGMGKEFLARIKVAGEITSGFFNDTVKIFTGFGNLLSAAGENLLRFDFLDTSNRIKNALGELNSTVGDMGSKLEQALGLVTPPLTEGKYSGQEIPKLGTEQKDKGAYPEPAPYTAGDGGAPYTGPKSSGGVLNPQEGYAYLRQLGVSHTHALGILANIGGESDFRIGVDEETGGGGVGLFQYTEAGRKRAFLKAVPDYRTNWKGQIKFAIGESVAPTYLKTQFSSPEEAAYWWMRNWEIPDSGVYTKRNAKHNAFIRSFKPSSSTSQQSPSSQQSQIPQVAPGASQSSLPTTKGKVIEYLTGDRTSSRYRADHAGENYHDHFAFDSRSTRDAAMKWLRSRGWTIGSINTGKHADDSYHYSNQAFDIPFYPNQSIKGVSDDVKGETSLSSSLRKDLISGGFYGPQLGASSSILSSQTPSTPAQTPSTPAQISPASTQQRAGVAPAITPDRRPQDIIVYQPPNQQKVISSSGGGDSGAPSSTPISNTDLLNNFIRNKLLLDLAYL